MNKKKRTVMLTGGIASGKTFASDYLQAKGARIIDTDLVAKMMTRPDNPAGKSALLEIRDRFGAQYILEDGSMDRVKMRALVFEDAEAKRDLEAILHGRILAEVRRKMAEPSMAPYIVVVVPVLYKESPYLNLCDEVLVIEVPYELQLQRLMARDNIDASLAEKIIKTQISRLDRRRLGNDIIISQNREFVQRMLDKLHQRYSEPL